jgi:hypothetical protein
MKRSLTKDQVVAKRIAEMVSDVTLDLDEVGKALANAHPTIIYNRVMLLAEAAVEERTSDKGHPSLNDYLREKGF